MYHLKIYKSHAKRIFFHSKSVCLWEIRYSFEDKKVDSLKNYIDFEKYTFFQKRLSFLFYKHYAKVFYIIINYLLFTTSIVRMWKQQNHSLQVWPLVLFKFNLLFDCTLSWDFLNLRGCEYIYSTLRTN